ncbi:MAG: hypothetical protein K1X78_06770 [Verrucomicrobiaceae bacterium]|nr:hypothetical protein [Verrucomicrobiaceae bacterium]
MKKFLVFVSMLMSLLTAMSRSADAVADVTYTGEISGVVCASCKEHVTTMLMKKLDGVVSVDVKPGDKPEGNQKLVIVAKSDKLTKEKANEALGTFAKNYEIVSLTKKG